MTLLKQLQSFCNMRYFNRPLVSTDSKPLRKQGNRPASAPIESGPGRAACRRSMRFGRSRRQELDIDVQLSTISQIIALNIPFPRRHR